MANLNCPLPIDQLPLSIDGNRIQRATDSRRRLLHNVRVEIIVVRTSLWRRRNQSGLTTDDTDGNHRMTRFQSKRTFLKLSSSANLRPVMFS